MRYLIVIIALCGLCGCNVHTPTPTASVSATDDVTLEDVEKLKAQVPQDYADETLVNLELIAQLRVKLDEADTAIKGLKTKYQEALDRTTPDVVIYEGFGLEKGGPFPITITLLGDRALVELPEEGKISIAPIKRDGSVLKIDNASLMPANGMLTGRSREATFSLKQRKIHAD